MEWAAWAAVVAASAAYSLRQTQMRLPIALALLGIGGADALAHCWYGEEDRRRKRDDELDDGSYYCSQLPLPAAATDADGEENERRQSCTADIDESSAQILCDAESYVKANAMLIHVPVLGTTKTFWRLSDEATRISRKLALILRSHHSVGKYLTAPLQVSNIWISCSGFVKLRGVRDDYKHLSRVLRSLIRISGGDITKLPPDYIEFLRLLESDNLAMKDEFLIVNNSALLPMKNR